ncbi:MULTISPECIES: hypothetical protein [Nocardiopsis]|uniref:Uncharacterized protein n=1 Tax=Nocardiopsis changdeensis TaxID=2831969 RepID=A0ABX8BS07_9ACTN|nr:MULTISPECIES: hypothetical protein [Nocardiopsis]QUX24901.1 hypothetical protein KGD84_11905 [Nocardiopsis changdeensis]QYX35287.1 hypothetical protein K1J57_21350 [Nocardiopsis sp. MT53]
MAHNHSCANAKNPGCRCSGCGGSLHGWPAHFERAAGSPSERDRFRRHTDLEWVSALGTGKTRENRLQAPTLRLKRAGTTCAAADAADWLARDPDLITAGRDLGHSLHDTALPELHRHAAQHPDRFPGAKELDKTIPGHFWCTLLAELSGAGDTVQRYSDRVPELAKQVLLDGEIPPDWGPVQNHLAEAALTAVWKCAGSVLLGDFTGLIRIARLVSLFICPDPARHPLIVRRSLVPLVKEDVITETTLTRLQQAFPTDPAP